jgi:hypothetical protein
MLPPKSDAMAGTEVVTTVENYSIGINSASLRLPARKDGGSNTSEG